MCKQIHGLLQRHNHAEVGLSNQTTTVAPTTGSTTHARRHNSGRYRHNSRTDHLHARRHNSGRYRHNVNDQHASVVTSGRIVTTADYLLPVVTTAPLSPTTAGRLLHTQQRPLSYNGRTDYLHACRHNSGRYRHNNWPTTLPVVTTAAAIATAEPMTTVGLTAWPLTTCGTPRKSRIFAEPGVYDVHVFIGVILSLSGS